MSRMGPCVYLAGRSLSAIPVVVGLTLCARPLPAMAQEPAAPPAHIQFSLGVGIATDLYRTDQGARVFPFGAARAALVRRGSSWAFGPEWIGVWGRGDFGGEERHHMGFVSYAHDPATNVAVRVGAGLGAATLVRSDAPPPGTRGDLDVGVGTEVGLSLLVEVDWMGLGGDGWAFVRRSA